MKERADGTVRRRCPDCNNYMIAMRQPNGSYNGQCKACKAFITYKDFSPAEGSIKIVRPTVRTFMGQR